MKININNKYHAAFDTRLLGYVGETNSRTIEVDQPAVSGADTYRLRFEYSDGTVYDVPIVDGEITLTASILRESGEVNCQWIATKSSGDTYELVAKSQVFALLIGESISDDVAPIPTYEQSQSMLDQLNEGINSKITEPEQDGTSGQVLATDGNGGRYWQTIQGGGSGENGATFTPAVSPEGVISWTNDKDLPNPEPVNIKGEQGVQGERGTDGYTPARGVDFWTAEDIAVINTHNDSYIDTKFAEAEQDINSSVQRAEQAASSMSAKIDKNQGENNSGKFLAVGDDGNVTLVDDPTNRHYEDVLLGTLPYTINDNNCYITADSDATITNGGGATDIYAREGEYLVGSPTIEWGNRSAIITLGSSTVGVYTRLSFDWTPSKTYTLFWKSDLTNAIIRILYRTTEGYATTEYLGTILVQGTQPESSIGSYNYTSFTVPEGTVRLNLALGGDVSATSDRTITFYDLMILEGEYTAPPKSQTFTLYAGEKMPVDGYIGSTLECTNGVTVSVYQKQDSSDTDSGGVIFFGDSILDFSTVIERYAKKTGKSCIDCAVGGTRMSASRDPNNEYYKYDMTQIVDAIINDDLSAQVSGGKAHAGFLTLSTSNIAAYKAIVCEFGTNDFTADVPFEGAEKASVQGAMRYIIEQLTATFPNLRLVFVGTKRFVGIGVGDDTHIHADGTTEDLNAIMQKTCEEYGIPFIDMIHLFGDTAITRSTLTSDGVHLSEPQGAKRYADILTAQLNQIGI